MSDIMGAFEVENEILKSFDENSSYQLKTENGFCDFGKKMNIKMNKFLENLARNESNS